MSARLFASLAQRIGFPAMLGELLLGVALGNLPLLGITFFSTITHDPIIIFIAELGVIVLLQIGLEARLKDLVAVGPRAFGVGTIGIVVPFVLGAAVIDDVLGLVILAVVSSLVSVGTVSAGVVGLILAKAVLFLGGSIGIGRMIAPWTSRSLARLDAGPSMLFAQVLSTALALSWLAHAMGLAPIIGAFAAGLLFEPVFLRKFERPAIVREIESLLPADLPVGESLESGLAARLRAILAKHSGHQHEHMIEPIGYFFVPVFFVLTGMQVDLQTLADPSILVVGLGVTTAAIVGKLVAGLAAGREAGAWLVGWDMVPRGEVGLIFALTGRQLGTLPVLTLPLRSRRS